MRRFWWDHGLRWQGGSRDTACERAKMIEGKTTSRAVDSGVALYYPPPSMTQSRLPMAIGPCESIWRASVR